MNFEVQVSTNEVKVVRRYMPMTTPKDDSQRQMRLIRRYAQNNRVNGP